MTNNQTDIFALFNLVDEHEEEKNAKATAQKKHEKEIEKLREKATKNESGKQNISTNDKKEKKVDNSFTPNENTIIRYYGESLEINQYFTPEELAEGVLVKKKGQDDPIREKIEPEMLRKRMEKDFPELVKSHTEIIFLKAKNIIIPTMKAKKKGADQGVLSKDSTLFATTKIPFSVLRDFIAVAKQFAEFDLEVHADIYYNKDADEFFLDIPEQRVHQFWTVVTEDAYSIVERVHDATKVLEIHSHHSMYPIPSTQDDMSETVPGMHYAIVGLTNLFMPNIQVRKYISKDVGHIPLQVEDVFSSPFDYVPNSLNVDKIEVCIDEY